jgi:hypothetical protein
MSRRQASTPTRTTLSVTTSVLFSIPPGSACSIALGKGITEEPPGSVQGVQMVVSDIKAARAELVERGVDVGDVQVFPWGSFLFFKDPDGNGWAV